MKENLSRKDFLTVAGLGAASLGAAGAMFLLPKAYAEEGTEAKQVLTPGELPVGIEEVHALDEEFMASSYPDSTPITLYSNEAVNIVADIGNYEKYSRIATQPESVLVETGWQSPNYNALYLAQGSGIYLISENGRQGKLEDWVVEESDNKDHNNGWVWRKWASGIAEAWWSPYTAINIDINWSTGLKFGQFDLGTALPFTFAAVPSVECSVHCTTRNALVWAGCNGYRSTSNLGQWMAISGDTYIGAGWRFDFSVKGRWK